MAREQGGIRRVRGAPRGIQIRFGDGARVILKEARIAAQIDVGHGELRVGFLHLRLRLRHERPGLRGVRLRGGDCGLRLDFIGALHD